MNGHDLYQDAVAVLRPWGEPLAWDDLTDEQRAMFAEAEQQLREYAEQVRDLDAQLAALTEERIRA